MKINLVEMHQLMKTAGYRGVDSRRFIAQQLGVPKDLYFHACFNFLADLLMGRLEVVKPDYLLIDKVEFDTLQQAIYLHYDPLTLESNIRATKNIDQLERLLMTGLKEKELPEIEFLFRDYCSSDRLEACRCVFEDLCRMWVVRGEVKETYPLKFVR